MDKLLFWIMSFIRIEGFGIEKGRLYFKNKQRHSVVMEGAKI
jgi:hypothetical protein